MKKFSKIWKIEHFGYSHKTSGWEIERRPIETQLIYESELDCVLDIVTEDECKGLKVYRHQNVIREELDEFSEVEASTYHYKLGTIISHSSNYTEDEYNALPSDYRDNYEKGSITFKSYTSKKYHWVEVFMQ